MGCFEHGRHADGGEAAPKAVLHHALRDCAAPTQWPPPLRTGMADVEPTGWPGEL
jgi:hypothetical protein